MKTIKITAVGGASAIQFAVLAISSLILAKLLTVEDFGITRIVTAYMVVLTLLGHFCLQDAVATYVASAKNSEERAEYIICGTYLTLAISFILVIISEIAIQTSGLWSGELKIVLAVNILFLPAASLVIVYSSLFQAIGCYKKIIIYTILEGIVPAALICGSAAIWDLTGWISGRCTSYLLLLLIEIRLIKILFKKVIFRPKIIYDLLKFARIQILSGALSMVLQVMDIFAIERLTGNLSEVAVYGLAAQFTRSVLFIPGAMGRVYFHEIAETAAKNTIDLMVLIKRYLLATAIICIGISVAVYYLGPIVIEILYKDLYSNSIPILKIMCFGIILTGIWTTLSITNIALKMPSYSLAISLSGVLGGFPLLSVLVPRFGANGAAWAMNGAYFIGGIVGLVLLIFHIERTRKNEFKRR